jgi:hypothetical protein
MDDRVGWVAPVTRSEMTARRGMDIGPCGADGTDPGQRTIHAMHRVMMGNDLCLLAVDGRDRSAPTYKGHTKLQEGPSMRRRQSKARIGRPPSADDPLRG